MPVLVDETEESAVPAYCGIPERLWVIDAGDEVDSKRPAVSVHLRAKKTTNNLNKTSVCKRSPFSANFYQPRLFRSFGECAMSEPGRKAGWYNLCQERA
jgi:hypothetical protein